MERISAGVVSVVACLAFYRDRRRLVCVAGFLSSSFFSVPFSLAFSRRFVPMLVSLFVLLFSTLAKSVLPGFLTIRSISYLFEEIFSSFSPLQPFLFSLRRIVCLVGQLEHRLVLLELT